MLRLLTATVAAMLLSLSSVAAADDPVTRTPSASPLPSEAGVPDDIVTRVDELRLQISQKAPAFAGYYQDGNNIVVRFVGPKNKLAVQRAVKNLINMEDFAWYDREAEITRIPELRFEPAKYTYDQLSKWRDSYTHSVLDTPGVVYLSASYRKNRLRVGIAEDSAKEEVLEVLSSFGVPQEAIEFVQSEYPEFQNHRLNSEEPKRPVRAGFVTTLWGGIVHLAPSSIMKVSVSMAI